MPSRNVSVVILCEDTQQEVFVRAWLESKGLEKRKFRVIKSIGGGSGEQFVRNRYPIEVKEVRRVATHRPVGVSLATMIDADTYTVQERYDMLNDALVQARQIPRSDDEKIAILIPKRNIETWIHYLQGEYVSESEIYRKLEKPSDCKPIAAQFIESPLDSPIRTNAPESLQIALIEMGRIV